MPVIWLPGPTVRADRERARFRLHLVKHRTALKNRIHASLMTFGHPCPVSDLFGVGGRELLDRLEFPEPWRGDIEASLRLIDELGKEITGIETSLRAAGADHPYVPLLMSLPGAGWILAYTIAAEIGDIARFANPGGIHLSRLPLATRLACDAKSLVAALRVGSDEYPRAG